MAREIIPAAEDLIDKQFNVLDHGFVTLIDYMGGDEAIVKAARNSIGGAAGRSVQDNTGLIRYLLRHAHTSPMEMVELKLHCKMPIFVARQWIRHRTASVNELSGRYSVLPDEFYLPDDAFIKYQSSTNNQGGSAEVPEHICREFRRIMEADAQMVFQAYDTFLGKTWHPDILEEPEFDEVKKNGGIARETARINLPLATYTMWYWKIDLHNLMHFLKLRMDKHAQSEIRAYADIIYNICKAVAPITMEAFDHFIFGARKLSLLDRAAIRELSDNQRNRWGYTRESILEKFPTQREKDEFIEKLEDLCLLWMLPEKTE